MSFLRHIENVNRNFSLVGEFFISFLLLILRIFWGYLFLQAGWGKIQNIESVIHFFSTLGIPAAVFQAHLVAWVEFLGGLFLIFGFLTRVVTIPLIITMIVAFLTTKFDALKNFTADPSAITSLTPFTFLLVSLILFCFGPGKYSLDYLIHKFINKKEID